MTQAIALEELYELARRHKMSPSEKREQRASLIMGLRARSSTLTREKVEELLDEIEGTDEKKAP